MSKRYGITEDGSKFSYGSIDKAKAGDVSSPRNIHYNTNSRQALSTRESTRKNMFMSTRSVRWGAKSLDLRMVPSLLTENIRLFTTQLPEEVGRLYMREDTFYNREQEPSYALSVSPEIYQQIMTEMNDSYSTPLGLYFCCHGGDAAHTGVAHNDYVNIGVAWIFVGIMMLGIIILSVGYISIDPDDVSSGPF